MLATASFLKQLLHEKLLLFNPLPKLATRNLVALQRSTIPHQRILSICPAKNHTDQFSVKLSPVVKQTPENSVRSEKPNFLLTPFAASHDSRSKNILRKSGLPVGKVFGRVTPVYPRAKQFLPYIFDVLCTSFLPEHCEAQLSHWMSHHHTPVGHLWYLDRTFSSVLHWVFFSQHY